MTKFYLFHIQTVLRFDFLFNRIFYHRETIHIHTIYPQIKEKNKKLLIDCGMGACYQYRHMISGYFSPHNNTKF